MEYNISKEESKRINIVRLICIILVLYIHVRDTEFNLITTNLTFLKSLMVYIQYYISEIIARGAVPIFFLLSGILLYRKNFTFESNIKKKIKTILIPFLFWNAIWIILFSLFQKIHFTANLFSNSMNDISSFKFLDYIDAFVAVFNRSKPFLYPLWFLKDLFVLNIFAIVIKKVMDRIPYLFIGIIFVLWNMGINTPIFEMQSLFFFSLGFIMIKKNIKISSFDNINFKLISIIYIIVTIIYCFYLIKMKDIIILHNCINIFTIIYIFRLSKKLINIDKNRYIKFAIENTFFVFLFHEWNLLLLRKVLEKVLPYNILTAFVEYLIIPIVILMVALCICYLWKKINYKSYKLVTGER